MKQKHGTLWEVKPKPLFDTNKILSDWANSLSRESGKGLYLGYGYPEPTGQHVHPLRTLERDDESGDYFESVRYFKKEDEND